MLYDAVLAQDFAAKLLEEGIYVIGFFFPVVAKGQARIRVQLSAAHEQKHLDKAIEAFTKVGIFSGSLWWRNVSQDDPEFVEEDHRIMHNEIRRGNYHPGLKFFFETGTLDEVADRNNNGIIDSIDDTVSLINELVKKGYHPETDIRYMELKDGSHDVPTWARALPDFLKWGWRK